MDISHQRVLVTGGAGFIGSHLVDALVAAGNDVVVLDDLSTGDWAHLAHHGDSVERIAGSVLDEQAVARACHDVALVFHLATRNVRLSLRQPTLVHEVNTTGTLNVLKAATAAGVQRLLYCSSSEVNGTADVVPMPEDYHFKPETIYGASKLTGEYYAMVFHRAGWLPCVIARPHNNYGPREHYAGDTGEVIPRFILWALAGRPPVIYGDGKQTRDFTYVTETAALLIKLAACDAALGETFNVCHGNEVSIAAIAELIAELTGTGVEPRHVAARPSDVLRLYGDNRRLQETLGEVPTVDIREGLGRTIEWFRQNVPVTAEVLASMQPENWASVESEPWIPA